VKKSLPLLIESARAARDVAARHNEVALAAVRESKGTVASLEQYRIEYLAAAPGTSTHPVSASSLVSFHEFVGRLDLAIRMQKDETERRVGLASRATQQLMEKQQKLFAFEALLARHHASQAATAARQEQRNSDEFAARLFRTTAAGGAA
jgi:flagellar protein FliJ